MSEFDMRLLLEKNQEEIERLKEQLNDEIDDELKQSEIMVKQQNEIERQKEIIKQLDIKNLELTTIIKEAINYIDDNTYYKDHKGHINIDDLYIILQGSDKEC